MFSDYLQRPWRQWAPHPKNRSQAAWSIGHSGAMAVARAALLGAVVAAGLLPAAAAAQAPTVARSLEDLTLTVGTGPHFVDLRGVYRGGPEECLAESSDESIITVSLKDGYDLTVTPVGVGDATVLLTASNEYGSVEHDFGVKVVHVAPAAVGALPDIELRVGDTVPTALAGAFSGEALGFAATSSMESVASVSVAGSTATVTAHAVGTTTVTVTATNTGGSAEQSFVVSVSDASPAAVGMLADLTIRVGDDPVAVDVAQAFSGTRLEFSAASSAEDLATVSISGAVATVMAVAAGTATVTVTAANSAGSAEQSFMVTVEDVPPAAGSLPDLTLITGGEAVLVDAADGFTGTALVYSASVSGDAVSVAVAGSQVTVVPLVEGQALVTVTATNTAGEATLSFGALVATDVAESDALENTVAALARGTLASITSALGSRFQAERMGAPQSASAAFAPGSANPFGASPQYGLSGAAVPAMMPLQGAGCCSGIGGAQAQPFGFGPASMSSGLQRLNGMSFAVPMRAAGSGGAVWTPAAEWTLWGHIDRQSFDGADYDGALTSFYIGADANFGDEWLAGVALSINAGDADYEFTSAQSSGTGDLDTDMVSVLPYVHWTIDELSEVWAITGAGWGDVDLKRSVTAEQGEADLSMWMLSAGGRRTLASGADWNFALSGDAGVLEMQTDDGAGIIDDMNISVGRVKVGFEGERYLVNNGGEVFSVFGQLSGRHDSGDGDTGSGVELAGGVRYDTVGRIRLEAKARLLSLHSAEDYEENGLSFSAMVLPRADGSGMSLALSSYLGAGMSANNASLEQGYGYSGRMEDFAPEMDRWGMDARLGYAVPVQRLSGLLTPFASFDMAGNDGHGLRMGMRYDLANRGGTMLNLEFTGGQQYDRYRRETLDMVQLRGELRF